MTVEVQPFGVACNLRCSYCYQNPERDTKRKVAGHYDLKSITKTLENEGQWFGLFGGEPLLMPLQDLERLWSFGLRKFGKNAIQTNGTLITDKHIELFCKYQVSVGISIDGPKQLNDLRWAGSLERTRLATEKTETAIQKLCSIGRPPSLIVTLHRLNASPKRLPNLLRWFASMDQQGIRFIRLHLLEIESDETRQNALPDDQHIQALLSLLKLQRSLQNACFDLFADMRNMLLGKDRFLEKGKGVTCTWTACDPLTTPAVRSVNKGGELRNCGRTYKEGIDFVKSRSQGFERYLALYNTPQSFGGCRGCRFFLMCKGYCPGTALSLDWRNRTEHCKVLKQLFRHIERELIDAGLAPISKDPNRQSLEARILSGWSKGRNISIASLLEQDRGRPGSSKQMDRGAGHFPTSPIRSSASNHTNDQSQFEQSGLDLMDFALPSFLRFAWVSHEAQTVWEPRILRIRQAWQELELKSVIEGHRRCAVTGLTSLSSRRAACLQTKLEFYQLQIESGELVACSSSVSDAPLSRSTDGPTVFGRQEALRSFREAWEAHDLGRMGQLLGNPACCTGRMEQAWQRGVSDPTWLIASRSEARQDAPRFVEVQSPVYTNILWRSIGIRALFHLPCSFSCSPSIQFAQDMIELGVRAGHKLEMGWLLEILDWPVEWSTLHGIAELKTPIFKAWTNSDPTTMKYVVRRQTDRYPSEGGRGMVFPYRLGKCSIPQPDHLT